MDGKTLEMDHCGLRSEPDGAPTTRSGSNNSVSGNANYVGQNGLSSPKNQSKEGSVCSDHLTNNSSHNNAKEIDPSGTTQMFNLTIGPPQVHEQRIRPGEFVLRVLFSEFTAEAEKKIEMVMSEPTERSLSKSLQRGEDAGFDQLLTALGSVAEHCLPSILRTLFAWYDRQAVTWLGTPLLSGSVSSATGSTMSSGIDSLEKDHVSLDPQVVERRDMAVEFIFCLVLIEVLKQLPFHPGHHDLIGKIEDLCFAHFKYREGTCINAANGLVIADLYAEVLGVLAQARFASVRIRFLSELAELRGKEPTAAVTQSIISLLMGMKFFRIKMAPIEDFEASFQFLTECAKYFLEVKQRDIKHALAGLFVEILVPVAATVKHEVNVPCLKSFVEMLYAPTLDMCTRSKHRLAIFPLVTCLLCVSQKPFFLHNWHYFLAMCLSQLKSREPKMSRVALESLYRLLWAYMIRIKCESNSATQSRLLSVVNSLFPKGSKGVVPRDTPLNIFVKIIQFIAQERLDFAMREIVFELLSVGRPIKIILTPERMNIGLRAFLVAADSLQQKDGEPPMPRSANVMPSGNTLLRVKKTFLNKVLTEDAARSIGMAAYYPLIRKVFTDILRALDLQCGRPLLLTTVKEQEESLLTGDRKAKIDLFRTCVAAIPRLIPDGMSRTELLSLLARLTLHIDEELRGLAFQSLQSLLIDFPDWRNDVLSEFLVFASKEVPDTSPLQLDNSLRMLVQLLTSWRSAVANTTTPPQVTTTAAEKGMHSRGVRKPPSVAEVHLPTTAANSATCYQAEGLALLMLCSVRSSTRRIGCHILKEIKSLSEVVGMTETPVIDVLDRICPSACEKLSNILPPAEKQAILAAISSNTLDLQWLTDRSCSAWFTQEDNECVNNPVASASGSLSLLQSAVSSSTLSTDVSIANDPWAMCLKHFLDYQNVPTQCPRAVLEAWSVIMTKITALYSYLEPSPVQDNRASLLRSATTPRKPPTDRNLYFKLWRNYLLFAFRTVPPNINSSLRCISPDMALSSSPEAPDGRSPLPLTSAMLFSVTPSSLYKLVVPLIRLETVDIRDLAVHSLGLINHMAVKDLFEEMAANLKEACDRKQENVRRRKRKDNLRLQMLRILEIIAKEKTFGKVASSLAHSYTPSNQGHHLGDGGAILPIPLQEFFESCKGWLETETDREFGFEMRLNFCKGLHCLLDSFELDLKENLLKRETKKQLFQLCVGWAGPYAQSLGKEFNTSSVSIVTAIVTNSPGGGGGSHELEFSALQAAAGLLTCGPVFQQSLLTEESHLYSWLDYLVSSQDSRVNELGEKVIIMLLEFNPDVGSVLEWVVARCFTGAPQIADACFRAIATLFSAREYPCDRYVAIINSALLYSGCPKFTLQQTAFRLLQVLDRRFFGGLPPLQLHHLGSEINKDNSPSTLDALLSRTNYAKGQTFLSKQLSFLHPELTMPIFSEISWRMKSARSDVRQSLLRYLQPWLHNMELVEPAIPSPNVIAPLSSLELDVSSENLRQSVSSSSSCSLCGRKNFEEGERLVRRGWGSTEATEMVLNNLLYLTAKFGDEHEREIEECWQTLCCSSPNNQRVVLYYLLIVTGLAPSEILPHAKRVLIYLFKARPVRLLEDLIAELQTVESLSWLVERTETPPFYRLSHLRKTSSYSDSNVAPHYNGGTGNLPTNPNSSSNSQFPRVSASELEKGTIHTKRRSAEESSVFQQPPHLRSSSSGAAGLFRSEKTRTISGPAALPDTQFLSSEREEYRTALYETEQLPPFGEHRTTVEPQRCPSSETIAPGHMGGVDNSTYTGGNIGNNNGRNEDFTESVEQHLKLLPLPMPEYGGYYAPLKEFLPPQPVTPFHRCNLAMMFISELINEGTVISVPTEDSKKDRRIDWCSQYLSLIIHMAFLGLDHLRPLVNLHSYSILINLLTVSGAHRNHLAIAKLSLNQQTKDMHLGITSPHLSLRSYNFLDPKTEFVTSAISSKAPTSETLGVSSPVCQSPSQSPKSSPRTPSKRPHTPINLLLVIPEPPYGVKRPLTIQEKTLALIKFLTERRGQSLWNCEDITARVWNIRSANQLCAFLQNTFDVFAHSYPNSHVDRKWAQVSLQIGLACSSRHYAGRSLQVFRALKVPLVSRILCDILSRLVETVAEAGDDMQGYVTELILTLEACVEAIPLDDGMERESTLYGESTSSRDESQGKMKDEAFSPSQIRPRSGTETFGLESKRPEMGRSRSVQSLNGLCNDGIMDDNIDRTLQQDNDVIPQVFWLALSLLESDFEYEYLLALRLLEKVMDRLPLNRLECRDKVDRVQAQLQWNTFSGIIPLILKGCSNPNTYEQSLSALLRFIPFLDVNFVDPTGESGYPLAVVSVLPFLLVHYDDPTPMCIKAAQLIAEVGARKGDSGAQALQHLSTVMTLYSRRSFSKESMQWTKCVIKYLYDSYSHLAPLLLGFLLDVLEKGPPSVQPTVLIALNCSFNYVDLTSMNTVSTELLRAIEKHLDGPYWRESLKILKLVVTRSSSLVAPAPQSYTGSSGPSSMASAWDSVSTASSVAFTSDSEFSYKKELPGRTMEFTFDVSQTPIIGRRHVNSTSGCKEEAVNSRLGVGLLNSIGPGGLAQRTGSIGEIGMNNGSGGVIQSNWKRPWQCQSKVRECLVSVLNACGQRVGLPKSPSVIFSQSSELLERQSSVASSTEEVSVAINDASGASRLEDGSASDAHFRVFRDFDFLEYELESVEGESSDNFNWGVRRRPLSELGTEPETEGETENEGVGSRRSRSRSQTSSDPTTMVSNSLGNTSARRPGDMPLQSGQLQEESSDEEDLGLSPLDEHGPPIQGRTSDPPTPQPNSLNMIEVGSSQISSPARSRRLSDTSLDSRSEEETTPCNLSPQGGLLIEEEEAEGDDNGDDTDANITSEILTEGEMDNGDEASACSVMEAQNQTRIVDDFQDWKSVLQRFLIGIRPLQSLESIQTMSQMVQTSFCKVIYICQDITSLLTSLGFESASNIAQIISVLLDFSNEHNLHMAAWHLWSAKDLIKAEEVKIHLLEASEHLETLNDRKETLQECVEGGLKPLVKLKALEGELPTYEESQSASFADISSADPFEIIADVSKLLYRTLFQLRLLLECHQRAVQSLSTNTKLKVRDLSRQVLEVRAALLQCISTNVIQGDKGSKQSLGEAEGSLLDLLLANHWENAIELFKANRDIWPKDLVGNSSNDITGILNIYCKYLSEEHSGVFVSIPNDFRNLCSQVNSVCLHLLENQQTLERKTLV